MKRLCAAAVVILVLGGLAASAAIAEGISTGLEAGSLGAGVQVGRRLTGDLTGRVGLFGYSYGLDFTAAGIDYSGHLALRHAVAMLDWHPAGKVFRLTVGLVGNDSELRGKASLRELADKYITDLPPGVQLPDDLGTLNATVRGNSVAPYAGIGVGRGIGAKGRWGFSFDLGTYYQGTPEAKLRVSTPLPIGDIPGAQEMLDEAIAMEQQKLQDVVSDYPWFPVVMLGVTYRF